ncbi:MAG: DUF1080 domain-containing protein, partial [Pedosphaera sp.]|nr:DUF1080 domain-containing protein [Pedosphaera sp.]
MNIRKIIVGLALGMLGWATAQAAGKDGFVSIFDGKTLKGWEAMPARTAPAWTVQDGIIVGNGDKGRG